jgi:HEAT repeat protein
MKGIQYHKGAMQRADMLTMLADHMEAGFLENIIDMFKHDGALYELVAELMADERSRVRIGTAALVEALKDEHGERVHALIPSVGALLRHQNPIIRADAVYLLSVIGHRDALPCLEDALEDESEAVRQVVRETVEELKEKG